MSPATPRAALAVAGPACPLCESRPTRAFREVAGRRYFDCPVCRLVHLDPGQRLGPAAERSHYGSHENDPTDPRYRRFLSRLIDPLVERIPPGAAGLDYGSGPGPTVSVMLRERGFRMETYDPFFAPDPSALDRTYDFITCTETAEHFFAPRAELARLAGLIRPGGWLGIMTETLRDDAGFASWRYVRDPTHVCFYRPETMEWIARRFDWRLDMAHPNVALFRAGSDRHTAAAGGRAGSGEGDEGRSRRSP